MEYYCTIARDHSLNNKVNRVRERDLPAICRMWLLLIDTRGSGPGIGEAARDPTADRSRCDYTPESPCLRWPQITFHDAIDFIIEAVVPGNGIFDETEEIRVVPEVLEAPQKKHTSPDI